MSTDSPPIEAVVAAPDEAAPRLAYADWADAVGQPALARFIRFQCTLSGCSDPRFFEGIGLPGIFSGPDMVESQDLTLSLLPHLLAPILELERELPATPEQGLDRLWRFFRFHVRRGFVEGLECRCNAAGEFLIQHAEHLFERWPLTRIRFLNPMSGGVDVPGFAPVFPETVCAFLLSPQVARVPYLEFAHILPPHAVAVTLLEEASRLRLERLSLLDMDLPERYLAPIQATFGSILEIGDHPDDIPF